MIWLADHGSPRARIGAQLAQTCQGNLDLSGFERGDIASGLLAAKYGIKDEELLVGTNNRVYRRFGGLAVTD
jgi:hypothetical protein